MSSEEGMIGNEPVLPPIQLTDAHLEALSKQDSRPLKEFQAKKFREGAQKQWDLFYKRNEDRFFKDRHWTTREFEELTSSTMAEGSDPERKRKLMEVGCGVGNFVFPLLEEGAGNLFIYACDFSTRAVDIVKKHPLYDEEKIVAFQADLTDLSTLTRVVEPGSVDVVSLVFVLSAIDPVKFETALINIATVLRPGGLLIFRDYGLYDMAMFRFKANTKVGDRHYVRQDGTMTFFFTVEEISRLVETSGFEVETLDYVERRTVNVKENVDVPRIFVQGKFRLKIKTSDR